MEEGADLPLPELEDGYHYIAALMEVGPVSCAGMDLAPLSWQEIEAWQRTTQSHFQPHELRLLRALSAAYLEQYRLSKRAECPSPEVMQTGAEKAKHLARRIKDVLRS